MHLDLSGLALDLEAPPIYYNKADYIQTASGNKVSRNSVLCGSQNITLVGNSVIKPGTVLRKHVIVGENCVLRPSHKKYKGSIAFFPMTIGDHVTILPPDTIVPPLTVFGGNPGVYLGDLPESQLFVQKQHAITEYKRFLPSQKGAGATSPKSTKAKAASP
eukprot:g22119.t1